MSNNYKDNLYFETKNDLSKNLLNRNFDCLLLLFVETLPFLVDQVNCYIKLQL